MCVWQISNLLSSFLNESIWNVSIFWMHQCFLSFWQIFEILWQNWSHNFSLTTEFFSAKSMKPKWQAVFSNVETSTVVLVLNSLRCVRSGSPKFSKSIRLFSLVGNVFVWTAKCKKLDQKVNHFAQLFLEVDKNVSSKYSFVFFSKRQQKSSKDLCTLFPTFF